MWIAIVDKSAPAAKAQEQKLGSASRDTTRSNCRLVYCVSPRI